MSVIKLLYQVEKAVLNSDRFQIALTSGRPRAKVDSLWGHVSVESMNITARNTAPPT